MKRAALLLLIVFMAFGVLIGCQDNPQQQQDQTPAPTVEPADDPMTDPANDSMTIDPKNDPVDEDDLDETDTVPGS